MKNKTGFTLIELLVVVLIIGILAAVALPQYEKAVLKSRMVKWTAVLDALKKNIEVYHLENGYENNVRFSGTDGDENNTVDLPCDSRGIGDCYINNPSVQIHSVTEPYYNNRGSYVSRFIVDPQAFHVERRFVVTFAKDGTNGDWYADSEKAAPPRIVCEWVQSLGYPGLENIVSACAAVGVTIPPYVE